MLRGLWSGTGLRRARTIPCVCPSLVCTFVCHDGTYLCLYPPLPGPSPASPRRPPRDTSPAVTSGPLLPRKLGVTTLPRTSTWSVGRSRFSVGTFTTDDSQYPDPYPCPGPPQHPSCPFRPGMVLGIFEWEPLPRPQTDSFYFGVQIGCPCCPVTGESVRFSSAVTGFPRLLHVRRLVQGLGSLVLHRGGPPGVSETRHRTSSESRRRGLLSGCNHENQGQ